MHILARSKLFNQTLTYDAIMLEVLQPSPPYAHHKSKHPASIASIYTSVPKLQHVLCGHKWRTEHSRKPPQQAAVATEQPLLLVTIVNFLDDDVAMLPCDVIFNAAIRADHLNRLP